MNEPNYAEITEALLKTIARSDEEFQGQIAAGVGVDLETFQDYLDNVEFPVVGRKAKHSV
jgi:hypothetical protein